MRFIAKHMFYILALITIVLIAISGHVVAAGIMAAMLSISFAVRLSRH
jgi:hypothetical protein